MADPKPKAKVMSRSTFTEIEDPEGAKATLLLVWELTGLKSKAKAAAGDPTRDQIRVWGQKDPEFGAAVDELEAKYAPGSEYPLNEKQKTFVLTLLASKELDHIYAYGVAFGVDMSVVANRSNAPKLMGNPRIIRAIKEEKAARKERLNLSIDEVIQPLRTILAHNPKNVMAWGPEGVTVKDSDSLTDAEAYPISSVAQTKDGIKITFEGKVAAAGLLGKHLGIFVDKIETTEVPMTVDQARDKMAELVEKAKQRAENGGTS